MTDRPLHSIAGRNRGVDVFLYSVPSIRGTLDLVSTPRITIEPGKYGGRACSRGLRISATDILSLLGAGASFTEILEDYPDLEADDILAALNYAAAQVDRPGLAPN